MKSKQAARTGAFGFQISLSRFRTCAWTVCCRTPLPPLTDRQTGRFFSAPARLPCPSVAVFRLFFFFRHKPLRARRLVPAIDRASHTGYARTARTNECGGGARARHGCKKARTRGACERGHGPGAARPRHGTTSPGWLTTRSSSARVTAAAERLIIFPRRICARPSNNQGKSR
jgi:hypothetical protein